MSRRLIAAATAIGALVASAFVAPAIPQAVATTAAPGPRVELRAVPGEHLASYGEYSGNWSSPDNIWFYGDGSGARFVVSANTDTHVLYVDKYAAGSAVREPVTSISFSEFPLWGGFYRAPDGTFYVVSGQDNPQESDAVDVVQITHYDTSWASLGSTKVQGSASQTFKGIRTPFEAGRVAMTMVGGDLIIHMARLMYAVDGVNHQSNMTLVVDPATMIVQTYTAAYTSHPYSSHSFNQFAVSQGNALYLLDHGDAYPRALQVTSVADYTSAPGSLTTTKIMTFPGAPGANYTGATATGFEYAGGHLITVGDSIPNGHSVGGSTSTESSSPHNVYLISTSIADGTSSISWLSDLPVPGSVRTTEPRLIKVSDNRLAVVFGTESSLRPDLTTLEYRLIDPSGTVLASSSYPSARFTSASQPVLIGNTIIWAGYPLEGPKEDGNAVPFLDSLDLTDVQHPTLLNNEVIGLDNGDLETEPQPWTGVDRRSAFAVTHNDLPLVEGRDYVIASASNTTAIGEGSLVLAGIGRYAGTATLQTYVIPPATTLTRLTPKRRSLLVRWKAVPAASGITGYSLAWRASPAWRWRYVWSKGPATKARIPGLLPGYRYTVKVVTYKTINGEKWVSNVSPARRSKRVKP